MIWSEFNKDRYLVPLPPLYIFFRFHFSFMKTKKTSIPNNIIVKIYITIDKFGTALLCPPMLYLFDQKYRNNLLQKVIPMKKKLFSISIQFKM